MSINVRQYILRFSLIYTVTLVAAVTITAAIDMDGNSSLQLIIIMMSGMLASDKFIKDNMRVPNKTEKRRLVLGSFVCANLISCILLAIHYFASDTETQTAYIELLQRVLPLIFAGLFAVAFIIELMLLSYTFGGMAKKTLEAYEKREQKNKAL